MKGVLFCYTREHYRLIFLPMEERGERGEGETEGREGERGKGKARE
jgi:hypothetical protein